jgi:hypothetical protein
MISLQHHRDPYPWRHYSSIDAPDYKIIHVNGKEIEKEQVVTMPAGWSSLKNMSMKGSKMTQATKETTSPEQQMGREEPA